jgi:hypothetical protein
MQCENVGYLIYKYKSFLYPSILLVFFYTLTGHLSRITLPYLNSRAGTG